MSPLTPPAPSVIREPLSRTGEGLFAERLGVIDDNRLNAMLLQMQKPGLWFAASEYDWHVHFRRSPKEGARPLLILWPFGPVALVYDEADTEGAPLPGDVKAFYASGKVDEPKFRDITERLARKGIEVYPVDHGDLNAGAIRVLHRGTGRKDPTRYRLLLNSNHPLATQLLTIAHEVGHLCLGHLGSDTSLHIPARRNLTHAAREIEAESVAYIVCHRTALSRNPSNTCRTT